MAKTPTEIASLARSHTKTAIKTLVGIMNQAKASPAARVSAANSLLDRGWGKPAQSLAIEDKTSHLFEMTEEEADARLIELNAKLAAD